MRSRVIVALCLAVAYAPSSTVAGWESFLPRSLENGAFLDLLPSFERDELRGGARPTRWSNFFSREKLTLFSNGYVYHPRFLQYQFSVGGALSQENYETSYREDSRWKRRSGLEYNGRLFFLSEHTYNLSLFASRHEPLLKEQAATRHESVETINGALFRYRRKPYFLNAGYVSNSVDSGQSRSDVTRVNLGGEYFKQFATGNEVGFNGAFNPSWFSSSAGLDGQTSEVLLSNFLNLRRVRLSSSLTGISFDQESPTSGKFESNQLVWYELLSVALPWKLRTDLSYRYQDSESTQEEAGISSARTLSDQGSDLELDVVHRLYESLDTSYTIRRGSRTSVGGETTSLSNSLTLNYSKSIPRGRILAGVNLARGETESSGLGTDVVNEPHPEISVPTEAFTLNQQNIQESSILVFLRSPLEPFETVRLLEAEHYAVRSVPSLNTFEIQVYALPPRFAVPGTYDFLASYTLTAGDYGLRTDTFGSHASVELLSHALNPYTSYVSTSSEVFSGSFPGIPVDSKAYTAGLRVYRGPLRVLGEYRNLDWEVSPYTTWRAEVQYTGSLRPTIGVYATTAYQNKRYHPGTSAFYRTAFTEESFAVSGSVRKRLPSRNMFLSAGGSYSNLQGAADSQAYSLNASWNWKLGKLDLAAGASAYMSDTTGTTFASTRREHEYFYLRLRRQLF